MNRQEECHVRIRGEVMAVALRMARECWPAGSDNLIVGMAADAVMSALLQLRAAACEPGLSLVVDRKAGKAV